MYYYFIISKRIKHQEICTKNIESDVANEMTMDNLEISNYFSTDAI